MTRRLPLLLVCLTAALTGALTAALGPAAAGSSVAGYAPDRPAPLGAAYMVGLDIHTPAGRVVRAPLRPRLAGDTTLLGRSPSGWVVAAGDWFYLVAQGEATRLTRRNAGDLYVTELLSDDGRHVVSATTDQADHVNVNVYDLDGDLVAESSSENLGGDVEDAAGGHVYVAGLDGVDRLSVGDDAATRVVHRGADLVSLDHDTLFVRAAQGSERHGPTALSEPGRPRWRTAFDPQDISARGTYVLGSRGDVRRMRDGSLVRRVPVSQEDDGFSHPMGWLDDRVVLYVVDRGAQQALGRCDVVTGRCSRITPLTSKTVSLPTRVAGPSVSP